MKRYPTSPELGVVIVCLVVAMPAMAGTLRCPPDSVKVGNICVDTYEASVWQIPPASTSLVKKVQAGKAMLADLSAGGATQVSPAATGCVPGYPASFPASGQWTSPSGVYAVSVPGVSPSGCASWFQAAQACRLSGKRLLTNLEWQDAAAGTPDPGTDNGTSDCNINSAILPVSAGSRPNCKSSWGAFDMVGNMDEWVADWAEEATSGCTDSTTAYTGFGTSDYVCFGSDGSLKVPGALIRGGSSIDGVSAGVFAVDVRPFGNIPVIMRGFRCAR
jgi:hypothetical protein